MPVPPSLLTDAIKDLCRQGYEAYDDADFKRALRLFYQAWLKLPKPQSQHPEAGWVLTAIGDTYFRLAQYQQAEESLRSALHCEQMHSNPFTLLRLGQVLHDQQRTTEARSYLFKAYRVSGGDVFARELSHYLDVIRDLLPAYK